MSRLILLYVCRTYSVPLNVLPLNVGSEMKWNKLHGLFLTNSIYMNLRKVCIQKQLAEMYYFTQ